MRIAAYLDKQDSKRMDFGPLDETVSSTHFYVSSYSKWNTPWYVIVSFRLFPFIDVDLFNP